MVLAELVLYIVKHILKADVAEAAIRIFAEITFVILVKIAATVPEIVIAGVLGVLALLSVAGGLKHEQLPAQEKLKPRLVIHSHAQVVRLVDGQAGAVALQVVVEALELEQIHVQDK